MGKWFTGFYAETLPSDSRKIKSSLEEVRYRGKNYLLNPLRNLIWQNYSQEFCFYSFLSIVNNFSYPYLISLKPPASQFPSGEDLEFCFEIASNKKTLR